MGLKLTLYWASKTPQNTWRYRRKVPLDLRQALGKRESVKVMGKSEAQTVKNYSRFHAGVEAEIAKARQPIKPTATLEPSSPMEEFPAALARLKALGIDLNETRYREAGEFNDADARSVRAHDAVDSVAYLVAGLDGNTRTRLPLTKWERHEAAWKLIRTQQRSLPEQAKWSGMDTAFISKLRKMHSAQVARLRSMSILVMTLTTPSNDSLNIISSRTDGNLLSKGKPTNKRHRRDPNAHDGHQSCTTRRAHLSSNCGATKLFHQRWGDERDRE